MSVTTNTIQDFHIRENEMPTSKLIPIIKKKTHFHWGHLLPKKAVKSLGFKRKCLSKRKILTQQVLLTRDQEILRKVKSTDIRALYRCLVSLVNDDKTKS